MAKGPKMSWPGHDFTEANFQARGVGSACDVAENQVTRLGSIRSEATRYLIDDLTSSLV